MGEPTSAPPQGTQSQLTPISLQHLLSAPGAALAFRDAPTIQVNTLLKHQLSAPPRASHDFRDAPTAAQGLQIPQWPHGGAGRGVGSGDGGGEWRWRRARPQASWPSVDATREAKEDRVVAVVAGGVWCRHRTLQGQAGEAHHAARGIEGGGGARQGGAGSAGFHVWRGGPHLPAEGPPPDTGRCLAVATALPRGSTPRAFNLRAFLQKQKWHPRPEQSMCGAGVRSHVLRYKCCG